jgi:small nuclear ribonucleoprotein (snRNP)-like protein
LCIVIGTLKGYDQLMNLVLDEVKEAMTGTVFSLSPRLHPAYPLQMTKAMFDTASSAS